MPKRKRINATSDEKHSSTGLTVYRAPRCISRTNRKPASRGEMILLSELQTLGIDHLFSSNLYFKELICEKKDCGCEHYPLQLDFYSRKFKIAIEVNGSPHRTLEALSEVSEGEVTQESLDRYQRHDAVKIKILKRVGVTLLIGEYGQDVEISANQMVVTIREALMEMEEVKKFILKKEKREQKKKQKRETPLF